MSKFITISFLIVLIISYYGCTSSLKSQTINIKDIPIATQIDSTSYALGIMWTKNMRENGFKNYTYAFYKGVQDCIINDTSIMGIYSANKYLETVFESLKKDESWPAKASLINMNKISLITKYDTFSYALGFSWCRGAYGAGIDRINEALLLGLYKGNKDDTSLFTSKTAEVYLNKRVEDKRLQKFANLKILNENWLKDNASKPRVITLPSSLQYKIIQEGKGSKPSLADVVECHYASLLIDNTVFESSYENNNSSQFFVHSLIAGWREAIQLMNEGSEWELYIPYSLAYRSGGTNNKVPPYSTIIMRVELLKVIKAQ